MSFHGTSSPVSALTRSKRMGLRSRASSMRNERSLLRVPDISDTGTLRRPKLRFPVQIGRAMGAPRDGGGQPAPQGVVVPWRSARERLAHVVDALPRMRLQALQTRGRIADVEGMAARH